MERFARPQAQHSPSRAWYAESITEFLRVDCESIIGRLATNSEFAILPGQRDAWLEQVKLLQEQLTGLEGSILLEFSIPRMGKRVDVILLLSPIIFVLEFKVGETLFDRAAIEQVWDYALDLKNFHAASHSAPVIPVLVPTAASDSKPVELRADDDNLYRPIASHPSSVRTTIDLALHTIRGLTLDEQNWPHAPYRPTPTIIEAARVLYAHHSVEAIARYDAGAQNLRLTSSRIEYLVDEARTKRRKQICFVTGVPGAGKTLVGLNVATLRRAAEPEMNAVFLSGNGPLVAVLREALTQDEVAHQRSRGNAVRKGKVAESVKAFIQNVHHFRDDVLEDVGPPTEHVAIFDEAQRAWDLEKTADFMRRKKNRPGFSQSEPEFLISSMDRHRDWAVIVCLVGGGQEINTGEAGIQTWIEAVGAKFPHWHMHISTRLNESEYASGKVLDCVRERPNTHFDDSLHLAVSMRSFRAENVSDFVKALLDCKVAHAREVFAQLVSSYPIVLTRSLRTAKQWVRARARGTERFGLVASSKAQRLKPEAIDVRVKVNPVHWFLKDKDDTRSSYYMEDAATEFHVQGLELDWACVAWDADLRFNSGEWSHHQFRGDRWCRIAKIDSQRFLRNAYRVLLTRARQGMVIYVPTGEESDSTRSPSFYDSTYEYLDELGIPTLSVG
ncbi:MAG: DUF2075 domain-containing protein [Gemmataceae bacterium]